MSSMFSRAERSRRVFGARSRGMAIPIGFLCALGIAFPTLAEERLIDYPLLGVEIGQGWDTQKVSAIATGGSCIHYAIGHSQPGQATSVTLTEVSDLQQFMRAINVSADFSIKSLTSKVSVRSSFAQDQKFSSLWSSFAARAVVDNGFAVAVGPPEAGEAAKEYRSVIADPSTARSSKPLAAALQKSRFFNPDAIGSQLAAKIPGSKSPVLAERLQSLTLAGINGGVVRRKGGAAAPPVASGGDELTAYPGKIVLRKEYREMAKNDPDQFRKQCGDAFVFAIREGAEIDGLVTFMTTSREEQIALSVSARGSGATFSGSGAFAEQMNAYEQKRALNLTFIKTGGRGDKVPDNRAAVNEAINGLAASAASAPYRYSFTTASYDQLPNWPKGDDEVDITAFQDLSRAYGKWETLWADVTEVLDNTAESVPGAKPDLFLIGRTGATRDALMLVQDTALANLRSISSTAAQCTSKSATGATNACIVPAAAAGSDMDHRAKLPLPVAIPVAPLEALESDAEVKARVVDYWLGRVNAGRCAIDKLTPGYCLSASELNQYASKVPVHPVAVVFHGYQDNCLSTNGKNVSLVQKACDLSNPAASQKWRYDKTKKAIYQEIDGKSYCFDVNGGDTRDDAAVLGYDCHQGRNQQFSIKLASTNDAAWIVGEDSGRCVDAAGHVKIWSCQPIVNHKWRLVLVQP